MASYPTYTHAFDFYYKIAPTASDAIDSATWYEDDYYGGGADNTDVDTGWYNLSPTPSGWPTYPNILTRNTPQILPTTSVTSNGALAWGSAASDFFWNVLTPSMSHANIVIDGDEATRYSFSYNSESFLHNQFLINNPADIGVATYPITSSWIAYEPNMIRYASGSGQGYIVLGPGGSYFPNATIISSSNYVYSLPTSATPPTTTYPNAGANPTNIAYGDAATGSLDGRFFDLAGGCGITRASISASLVTFSANSSSAAGGAIDICTQELKKRRLFFPTVITGSMPFTAGSPGAWLESTLGIPSNEFFTENGGIYNVKFNIKRDTLHDYYPDSGQGSELKVFIADAISRLPTPSNRTAGTSGWYPPNSNIITIKNQPAMSFYNPATGFFMESFNINVVQYGAPAQLVFEAGGDLSTDNYFGCVIDDVTFCKVGVSTDPNLIKPQTAGDYVEEQLDPTLPEG
jgi:hypothetical protein